nr:MAG TPA: Putative minor structural protein 1 [Caudoviricetes sp.]
MSKAQGQFTIIDYNDALTLTGYIGSSHTKTQMYNPDNGTYTPDWATHNVVLTPSLYVIGTTTDKITSTNVTSVKWYVGSSTTAITSSGNYALSGAKSHILTIKGNVMAGQPGIDYRCVITYKDDSTGLSITHPLTISFARVVNGSGITDLLITTPGGNVFKNHEVATLTAKAELWRGSTVDTTNVTYKWAVMDSTVTSSSSAGYDAAFGTGWRKLTDTTGMYSGTTTATITVYAAAVDSYAVFKCVATDSDSTSNTYNSSFTDVATFIDNSDPIQVIVTSTGGDVFKNGVGSTVLTAVVYQAGAEIDADGKGTYTWTKYNKDGAIDTSWGTSGSKTGKTLSVSSADVATKATFMVVVNL